MMSENKNTKLTFKLGEESIPTILSASDLDTSPFALSLRSAKGRMQKMAVQLKRIKDNWINATPNNIITFLGDRGSGKTSCMRSLISDCKDSKMTEEAKDWLFSEEIDPSFFDEKHNVLEIIIGSLYGNFKSYTEDIDRKTAKEREALREIQNCFFKVKSALRYIKNTPDLSDEYEQDALTHLNDGGKIRCLLKVLINKILKYENKTLLIISIDDLDLNIERSYEMMEHLRKYLIIPNVIIIVAAKFSQLFDSVCLNLTKVYKGLEYRVSNKDIAEMAERYLNKIFPLDQRFEMPTVDSYLDTELIIEDENGRILYKGDDVKTRVPSLIFEKTRFLFYNSSGMPSLVIPRNLRDLRMLVSLLVKMKVYVDGETAKTNQRVFKDYFFQEWLGIIKPEFRPFAKSLLEEENLAKINRFVIKNLYDHMLEDIESYHNLKLDVENAIEQKKINAITREREVLLDILSPSNSYWNVSVGDVVIVMNTVRKAYDSSDVLALLFFIESFYSIKLYETYNKLSDIAEDNGLNLPKEVRSSAPELKTNVRGEMPEYFRLLGGGFFTPTGDFFISYPSNSLNSREFTLINATFLLDEIRFVAGAYKRLTSGLTEDQKRGKFDFPMALTRRLRFCEFFMLTVKFREDPKTYGFNYRLVNEPLYFKEFGNTAKNLVFDVTMPFVNAICPEFSYSRFNPDIFGYASMDKNSLLNLMTGHHKRGKDNDTWEIMSKAAIRNMEILEDITFWLHKNREKNNITGKDLETVLKTFYSQFQIPEKTEEEEMPDGKYWVKTYSKVNDSNKKTDPDNRTENDKTPYYFIHYSIYSILADVLAELDTPDSEGLFDPEYESPCPHNLIDTITDEIERRYKRKAIFNSIFSVDQIIIEQEKYTSEFIKQTLEAYINPAILNGILPIDKSFNNDELAQILANLRVDFRFDFDHRLPLKMQLTYEILVKSIFQSRNDSVESEIIALEADMSNLRMKQSNLTDENKRIAQDIVALEKERDNMDREMMDIQKKISEYKSNIDYFSDNLFNATSKADRSRMEKDLEANHKALNKAKAELEAMPTKTLLLSSKIKKAQTKIDGNLESIKDITHKIRQAQKRKDNYNRDIEQLKNSLNHPRALELKI